MLYKHYKGGLYRVIGKGKHTETFEDVTIYMSVETGNLWVRPTEMFNGTVQLPNTKVHVRRFEPIE